MSGLTEASLHGSHRIEDFDIDAAGHLSDPGSIPLPNGDFEPFFAEYADYDAALEESLSNICDLGIPQPLPHDFRSHDLRHTDLHPGNIRPSDLRYSGAKYYESTESLLLKESSSSPLKPAFFNDETFDPPRDYALPSSSPPESPVRPVRGGHARMDSLGISGLLDPRPAPLLFPQPDFASPEKSHLNSPLATTPSPARQQRSQHRSMPAMPTVPPVLASPSRLDVPGTPQSPLHMAHIPSTPMTPSDPPMSHISPLLSVRNNPMSPFGHPPATGSPVRQSPRLHRNIHMSPTRSPHFHQNHLLDEEDYEPATPSPDLHSELHFDPGHAMLPHDSFKWQPILTVPQEQVQKSEEIIESQRPRKNLRKSCLPPGAVDEYVKVCENGVFGCLYPNCGRLFHRRYNLRSHIQTHLSDRPYRCTVCEACFVRPHDLRRHTRVHNQDKEFLCVCGKGFNRQDALMRHRYRQICQGGIEPPENVSRTLKRRSRAGSGPIKNEIDTSPVLNECD